jgi:hypothetical protein
MKREKIGLIAITAFMTLSVGSVSAQSLAELRASHGQAGVKQHHTKADHRDRAKRVRHSTREKQHVTKKRQLAKAKRQQRKVDRKLNRKHAKRRNFKTLEQFKRKHASGHRSSSRNAKYVGSRHHSNRVSHSAINKHGRASSRHFRGGFGDRYDSWYDNRWDSYDSWKPRHTQRGYRHTRRSWYLTYLYERASFYDRHGYKYGYFSRRGFIFEGEFYRYDRQYTYRDRLRGRGLFERRYYRPSYSQFDDFFAGIDREGFYFYAGFDL